MGFVAGFADEWIRLDDRREKRKLLMAQLIEKRQGVLQKALSGKQIRASVSAQEEGALAHLKRRLTDENGDLVEGGAEALEAWRKTGTASEILGMAQKFENDSESKEVRLVGEGLLNSFYVAGEDQTEVRPTQFLLNLFGPNSSALADNEVFNAAVLEAQSLPDAGKPSGVVDFNPSGAFSGNNKTRKEVQDVFRETLATRLKQQASAEQNPELKSQFEGAAQQLMQEEGYARQTALTTWGASPFGAEVYGSMVEKEDIPAYQELNKLGGVFDQTREIYNIQNSWDTLEEEDRNNAYQRFPSLAYVYPPAPQPAQIQQPGQQ